MDAYMMFGRIMRCTCHRLRPAGATGDVAHLGTQAARFSPLLVRLRTEQASTCPQTRSTRTPSLAPTAKSSPRSPCASLRASGTTRYGSPAAGAHGSAARTNTRWPARVASRDAHDVQPRTPEYVEKVAQRLLAKEQQKRTLLKELGIVYDFPGYVGGRGPARPAGQAFAAGGLSFSRDLETWGPLGATLPASHRRRRRPGRRT